MGGYCSAPDFPLNSLSVISPPAKCRIVSRYHDKPSRYSLVFIDRFSFRISDCVFVRLLISKMAVSAFLRNRPLLKIKNSRIF